MDDAFKIYVEQLRGGQVEELQESFSPDFLEMQEKEISFPEPIALRGEAYLAESDLVLHFDVSFWVELPCVICNQPVKREIAIKGFYHSVPLAEIKSGIFNFRELLREMVLLELPQFVECQDGQCPERKVIAKYLKPPSEKSEEGEDVHRPFADLKLKKRWPDSDSDSGQKKE